MHIPIGLYLSLVVEFHNFTLGEFLAVLQVALNVVGVTTKALIMIVLFSQLEKRN